MSATNYDSIVSRAEAVEIGVKQSDFKEANDIEQLMLITGLKVFYRTTGIITSANLSFATNNPGIPIEYTIVAQPEYGVVQCRDDFGQFEICPTFTQNDIDSSRVQYKHSSIGQPLLDTFSFQVFIRD